MAYRLRKASLRWWHLNCLKNKRNLLIWGMEERLFQAGSSRCRESPEIRKIREKYLRNWETLYMVACAVCLVAQSCPTLCESMDCNLPGSCPWEFSRQGYWSGLPCPPPGDLPNPRIEPRSPALQAGSLPSVPLGKPVLCIVSACIGYSHTPNLSLPPTAIPLPFGNHKFISIICLWVYFYFVHRFICIVFLDSTCKWYHAIFVFSVWCS